MANSILRKRHAERMQKQAQPEPSTFPEQYEISFYLAARGGYWGPLQKEMITVYVVHGLNEKNNHERAALALAQKYPHSDVKIQTSRYI